MKFALVNNIKSEATKGAIGICQCCGSPLIARCGTIKVNHWAHKGTPPCDTWWEPETEWHRSWKDNYPVEWQEISLNDKNTTEKHIADIRTVHNLVIEFQHSYIDPKERSIRENFYQNMVWVVDGTRLKRDYIRFQKGTKYFRNTEKKGIFFIDYPEEVFSANWLNSSVSVVFDFKGIESITDTADKRNYLYCLFPIRLGRHAILAEIPRNAFINTTLDGSWSLRTQEFIDSLIGPKQEQQKRVEGQSKNKTNAVTRRSESQWILEKGKWKKRRRL